jgi:hypothetical protein
LRSILAPSILGLVVSMEPEWTANWFTLASDLLERFVMTLKRLLAALFHRVSNFL